jgi:hypothetical protein
VLTDRGLGPQASDAADGDGQLRPLPDCKAGGFGRSPVPAANTHRHCVRDGRRHRRRDTVASQAGGWLLHLAPAWARRARAGNAELFAGPKPAPAAGPAPPKPPEHGLPRCVIEIPPAGVAQVSAAMRSRHCPMSTLLSCADRVDLRGAGNFLNSRSCRIAAVALAHADAPIGMHIRYWQSRVGGGGQGLDPNLEATCLPARCRLQVVVAWRLSGTGQSVTCRVAHPWAESLGSGDVASLWPPLRPRGEPHAWSHRRPRPRCLR